jgi:hypothetical protein
VRSTKPLLVNGRAVTGLRMRFEGGRAVEIDADRLAEVLRELASRDDGAARLGELALVDGSGRIGLDTLLARPCSTRTLRATSRSAAPFGFLPEDPQPADRINISALHTDFMIGGLGVSVSGRTQRQTRPRGPRPRRNPAPSLAAPAAPPTFHADRSGRSTNATLARAKGGAKLIRPRDCFRLDTSVTDGQRQILNASASSPTRRPRPDCCFLLYQKALGHGPAARQTRKQGRFDQQDGVLPSRQPQGPARHEPLFVEGSVVTRSGGARVRRPSGTFQSVRCRSSLRRRRRHVAYLRRRPAVESRLRTGENEKSRRSLLGWLSVGRWSLVC